MREKGTDRSRFFRGQVDKYTWQDLGSSFLPGEVVAAFLWAQLENAENIVAESLATDEEIASEEDSEEATTPALADIEDAASSESTDDEKH